MAKRQFEFINHSENLTPALKQMLEFINNKLVANVPAINLLFKSKIILTELITNSLKHSNSINTKIIINITVKNIQISKIDYGVPLSLITYSNSGKTKVPVINDALHTLYAVPKEQNKVTFMCEENKMIDILSIDNIMEHFGLLIITKASDRFVYSYDPDAKSNTFTALLNY